MDNINKVMYNYEKYMHDLQKEDLYYAVFKLYQIEHEGEKTIQGFMSVSANCDTIIPKNPNTEFYFGVNRYDTSKISKFNASLKHSNGKYYEIEYNKFIEAIDYDAQRQYDADHVVVVLNQELIDEICQM